MSDVVITCTQRSRCIKCCLRTPMSLADGKAEDTICCNNVTSCKAVKDLICYLQHGVERIGGQPPFVHQTPAAIRPIFVFVNFINFNIVAMMARS